MSVEFSDEPRRYYLDEETGEMCFRNHAADAPDGALVREITAFEFYTRSAEVLACGWPAKFDNASKHICPCGWVFPSQVRSDMHKQNGRYFYSSEADDFIVTWDGSEPDDPLLDEVTEEQYLARQAQIADNEALS